MTTHVRLDLPDALRPVLPATRWEEVDVGRSDARVYRSFRHVLKVQRREPGGPSLFAEKERLRWFRGRIPVPEVVAFHTSPTDEYLAMTRLPGIDLSHADAVLHARRNTELLARALRELHALPIADCPFDTSLRVRLAEGAALVREGRVDEEDFDSERQGWTGRDVLEELIRTRPAHEDLVVTHGDACLPNVIVSGEYVEGFIDVGRAGIADRHVDLALATRSLTHNYGAEYSDLFLDTYGRTFVDEHKLQYYRLLDELF